MSDDALIAAMARGIYERRHRGMKNVWPWDDSGLDDEHPGVRKDIIIDATAALAALRKTHAVVPREPTEAMLATFHDTVQIACYPDEKAASIVNDRQVYRALLNTSEATDA